jgi:hypothetical protein
VETEEELAVLGEWPVVLCVSRDLPRAEADRLERLVTEQLAGAVEALERIVQGGGVEIRVEIATADG